MKYEPRKKGERVAYRASFLRSIGDYTAYVADRRGTVKDMGPGPLVEVRWDDRRTGMCHSANLILADKIGLDN